jgi:anti-sigma B factor antagonist
MTNDGSHRIPASNAIINQHSTISNQGGFMFEANVSMNVRKTGEQTCVVDIAGEINGFAENALMDAYTQATTSGARAIILNFSEMAYMNSSGIGLLVTLLIRAKRQRQRLLIYGLNEHYKQIFALTRLDEAIGIYSSEAEALAGASVPSVESGR